MAFTTNYEYKVNIALFFKRNIFKNNLFVKYEVNILVIEDKKEKQIFSEERKTSKKYKYSLNHFLKNI